MSLLPTPATTVARSPTASRTTLSSRPSSSGFVVGDSPVVPLTTRPSLPLSTRYAATFCAVTRSRSPSGVNGVIMAVSTRPKGACVVTSGEPVDPVMGRRYRPGASIQERRMTPPGNTGATPNVFRLDRFARQDLTIAILTVGSSQSASLTVGCKVSLSRLPGRSDKMVSPPALGPGRRTGGGQHHVARSRSSDLAAASRCRRRSGRAVRPGVDPARPGRKSSATTDPASIAWPTG